MRRIVAGVLCALSCATGSAVTFEQWSGRVVAVSDGDTLTVLRGKQQIKVRLAEIDAPERGQPFSARSKQSLVALTHGKQVRLDDTGSDRYGRRVARVYAGAIDVNREQVQRGMAWVYTAYLKDQSLLAVEQAAREQRRGIWAQSNPVAPWEWRQTKRRDSL